MSQFKHRFKDERIANGITQKDLSEILGVDRTSISKYENGKQLPEVPILEKISDYFNVSTDYLLGKTNNRNIETKTNDEVNIGTKKESDVNEVFNKCFEGENVFLCGEPLTDEDRILLEQSIKSTIELAKKMMNKKTK